MADITSALQAAAGAAGGGGGDPSGIIQVTQDYTSGYDAMWFFEFDGATISLASLYNPASADAGGYYPTWSRSSNNYVSGARLSTIYYFDTSTNAVTSVAATYAFGGLINPYVCAFSSDDSLTSWSSEFQFNTYSIQQIGFSGSALSYRANERDTAFKGGRNICEYNYDDSLVIMVTYTSNQSTSYLVVYQSGSFPTRNFRSFDGGRAFDMKLHPSANVVAVAATNNDTNFYIYTFTSAGFTLAVTYNLGTSVIAQRGIVWNSGGTRLAITTLDSSVTNTWTYRWVVFDWDGSSLSYLSSYTIRSADYTVGVDAYYSGLARESPSRNYLYYCTTASQNRYLNAYEWADDGSVSFITSYALYTTAGPSYLNSAVWGFGVQNITY